MGVFACMGARGIAIAGIAGKGCMADAFELVGAIGALAVKALAIACCANGRCEIFDCLPG